MSKQELEWETGIKKCKNICCGLLIYIHQGDAWRSGFCTKDCAKNYMQNTLIHPDGYNKPKKAEVEREVDRVYGRNGLAKVPTSYPHKNGLIALVI